MKVKIIDILNIIEDKKNISVEQLSKEVGLSNTSIRRYLSKLELDGLIERFHGGVKALDLDKRSQRPLEYKSEMASDSKERVANYAASLVKENKMCFFDSGSSILPMGKYINKDIFAVTCNLSLAVELGNNNIKVYLLPGYVNSKNASIYSEETYKAIKNIKFDQCFVSTTTVDKDYGFECHGIIGAKLKKEVIRNSKEKYILGEKTKYYKRSGHNIATLDEVIFITDNNDAYLKKSKNIIEIDYLKK